MGFAQNKGPCADAVKVSIKKDGITTDSPRMVAGTHEIHRELEKLVARFVKQEDAMVVNMGFATNSTTIPALVQKVKKNIYIYNYFFLFIFILIN